MNDNDNINNINNINLTITAAAAARIKEIVHGNIFRISIINGGCSGLVYKFAIEDRRANATAVNDATNIKGVADNKSVTNTNDLIFSKNDVQVIVNQEQAHLLHNATLDFVEDLMESVFEINNPQALASCGCGASFSISRNRSNSTASCVMKDNKSPMSCDDLTS